MKKGEGKFAYLSTILDAYTKQVPSYVLTDCLEEDFVLETVKKLVEEHGIELTKETPIHSDQGCLITIMSGINGNWRSCHQMSIINT